MNFVPGQSSKVEFVKSKGYGGVAALDAAELLGDDPELWEEELQGIHREMADTYNPLTDPSAGLATPLNAEPPLVEAMHASNLHAWLPVNPAFNR